ncbi:YqgE/AlgH family protein [uncultured Duncaniella sp.]|uniref:YqgE/AlgH family protein n=1 Tax=uncultured Duncaniella sp. TaxID=2768039 RepID=UPI0025A9B63B|nr:YqgE/AlgH family protein [uncultured Duncaniella sp.]
MIDFESLIFNIDIDTRCIPRPGSLLVAEPFLRERYFRHAVICLVDYEPKGSAMGIVLNNRTTYTLQDILPSVTATDAIPVYCGGPMSCDRLYFMHTLGGLIPDSREIIPGLYIGGDFDTVLSIVNDGYAVDGHIRFFLGYSGWDMEQLDGELLKNVWAVTEIPSIGRLLEGEEDSYWHNIVRAMGHKYRGWLYHPRNLHSN